jgi:hypothetical protein
MIAPIKRPQQKNTNGTAWHSGFLQMLPTIRRHAQIAFRNLKPEARGEAIQDVVANAMVAYARLFELGKLDIAYPNALARYGVLQHRTGRRVGNSLNGSDALSPYAQLKRNIKVERPNRYCQPDGQWLEVLVEDKRCSPADIAAVRLDFRAWLDRLSCRQRRIARLLASGESTSFAAKRFKVSSGRISQIRREFRQSWEAFQGDLPANAVATA